MMALFGALGSLGWAASSAALSSPQAPAVAWSSGVIRINGADHSGSGNVLPGARVETMRSASQLYLADGSRMRLGVSTRLNVGTQSVQLEGGTARIDSVSAPNRPLNISAGALEIRATGGIVQRPRANEVIVTASQLPTEVRKSNGLLVAMVRPGETLAFSMAANNQKSVDTRIVGQLGASKGKFYLTDEVTNLRTELVGNCLDPYVGKRIQIRGELTSAAEDRRVLNVKEIGVSQGESTAAVKGEADRCPAIVAVVLGGAAGGAAAAGTAGAGTAAAGTAAAGTAAGAAGAAAGMSTAVIAGVTVAGVAAAATTIAFVTDADQPVSQP